MEDRKDQRVERWSETTPVSGPGQEKPARVELLSRAADQDEADEREPPHARRVFLSKAGMTKMVDRLEQAGQVERVRPGPDRRVTSARLTPVGHATLHRSRPIFESWVEANLRNHLSDAEVISLRDTLRALLENHGRWEGQMRYLRGVPHDESD